MNTHSKTRRLKQDIVTNAISNLKIKPIVDEMGAVGWSPTNVEDLIGYVLRANGLVLRHPDLKKSIKRDKFLAEIAELVSTKCVEKKPLLEKSYQQLEIAESGYRRILASTDATEWKALAPAIRLAAIISRAVKEVEHAIDYLEKQIAGMKYHNLYTPVLRDDADRPVDPDSVIDAAVSGLGATLMMEGYQQKWFDNGVFVLPEAPDATDDDIYKAGSPMFLAANWERWASIEESSRYLGPEMAEEDGQVVQAETEAKRVYSYHPPRSRWYNTVATWRTVDRSRQSRVELERHPLRPRPAGLGALSKLAPAAFLTENEIHGYDGLVARLGFNIGESSRLIEGLRIVEWLRGYCVLSALCERRKEENGQFVQVWKEKELLDALCAEGLRPDKAQTFIEHATFKKGTIDLFDGPLIRRADGSFILFGPSTINSGPAEILMSVFGEMKVQFDGDPFENRVLELLRENHLAAQAFKFKIGKEEYEYDAVLVWNDQIFLFECKNRNLPGERAIPAYFFEKELRDNVKQIKRLRDGLLEQPDQLNSRFGPGTSDKPITMVILRNFPYSRDGTLDDVHFYDFSALSRFFASKELSSFVGPPNGTAIGTPHTKLWKADTPSPDDLLQQLMSPAQLNIALHHTRVMKMIVGLDQETVGLTEVFIREEMTPETLKEYSRSAGR